MSKNAEQIKLTDKLQKVLEKSIKANTQIMSETSKAFSKLLSNKTTISDLQKLNTEVLNDTLNTYWKINMQYAENLIDLSVQFSKSIAYFTETLEANNTKIAADSPTSTAATLPKTTSTPSTTQKSEIHIISHAGETTTTTFVLNNHGGKSKKCAFKASRCKSDTTGKSTNIRVNFSPKSFTLKKGEKVEVTITTTIPKSSKIGSYKSQVSIEGFKDAQFDLIIFVKEKDITQ